MAFGTFWIEIYLFGLIFGTLRISLISTIFRKSDIFLNFPLFPPFDRLDQFFEFGAVLEFLDLVKLFGLLNFEFSGTLRISLILTDFLWTFEFWTIFLDIAYFALLFIFRLLVEFLWFLDWFWNLEPVWDFWSWIFLFCGTLRISLISDIFNSWNWFSSSLIGPFIKHFQSLTVELSLSVQLAVFVSGFWSGFICSLHLFSALVRVISVGVGL